MTLKVFCALAAVGVLPFLFEATTGCGFAPAPSAADPNSYVCACSCEPGEHHREVRVSAALDDTEESSLDASDLDLGLTLVGLRFAGVQVPPAAAILSASVQFTADEAFGGSNAVVTNLDIYAIAADDVPAFAANTGVNLSGVARTGASAAWIVPPWSVNQSGPAQLTPNLRDIIQELVDRPGWQSGNALALIFAGLGRREAESFDGNPSRAAVISIDFLDPVAPAVFDLYVCVPPELDGNLAGGTEPTSTDALGPDCSGRVQPTLTALNAQCGYPSVCSCNVVQNTLRYAGEKCDAECVADPVDAQCTHFDPKKSHVDANAAGNAAPVCTVFSPLAADLFGQRTLCSVAGTAEVTATSGDDSDTESSAATGIVQFVGPPCPGHSCAAGMEYSLNFSDVEVGNFFASATFNGLAGVGESFAGSEAMIAPGGDGTFAPQSLGAAAQGRRDTDHLQGLFAANDDPVKINVGWGQSVPMCSVHGTLNGQGDPELKRCDGGADAGKICQADSDCAPDSSCPNGVCACASSVETGDLSLTLDLENGTILNQPPTADAGPDQTVECNAAAVTNAVLDGSGSSDPDGDIAFYSWRRGSRIGDEVSSTPIADVQQAVGPESYVLRVIDSHGQADESTTEVDVVDTTPPLLSCSVVAPVRNQTNHDLVDVGLAADAVDQCEGVLPVTVKVFSDEDDEEDTGDGRFSPDAANIDVGSLRLRAERKGNGDGRVYLIVTEATDSAGNRGFDCCTVAVPHSAANSAQRSAREQAAAARGFCLEHDGMPPTGYFVVGDGPVRGPKQ